MGFVEMVGGIQERLGRDAANVQAGAAQGLATLNHSGFQAQLGAADGADIATRAGADHDHIKLCHGVFPLNLASFMRLAFVFLW